MSRPIPRGPRIVVTVAVAERQGEPETARRKNELYAASLARQGAEPFVLDATAGEPERAEAFATMDGLLLSGGADIDPTHYGRTNQGSTAVEPDRDGNRRHAQFQAEGLPRHLLCLDERRDQRDCIIGKRRRARR
jgi:gamma-glutamyl-gamma-aminobutyrate hydrolase PuuD